jgi:hypothetical protein
MLNVAGPRKSKELGVYEWTLAMLQLFFIRMASAAGSADTPCFDLGTSYLA